VIHLLPAIIGNRRTSTEVRRFSGVLVVGIVLTAWLTTTAAFAQGGTAGATGSASSSAVVRSATPTSAGSGSGVAAASATPGNSCQSRPVVPAEPAASGAALHFGETVYSAGTQAKATAVGFQPGEKVQVALFGTNTAVTVKADLKGTVTASVAIPADALAGMHTVQFTGWCTTRVAVGQVLVSRIGTPAPALPGWTRWALGGLGLVGLGYAGWLAAGVWQRHRQEI
jgi:hypothetical protein